MDSTSTGATVDGTLTRPVRAVFREAAEAFATLVASIPDRLLDEPALDRWSVRDLIGHTSRAISAVERGLANSGGEIVVPLAWQYFAQARATDQQAVTHRAREAAAALGADPATAVRSLAVRVSDVVDDAPDGLVVSTLVGGMPLEAYLVTRIVELTVHSLDLMAACRMPWHLPPEALRLTLGTLSDLAVDAGSAPEVALALTGRRPLADNFTVL